MTGRCASACCWSSLSDARLLRAPSSPCGRRSLRPAVRRTASTNAAGSPAAASTSSSTVATGGSSATAAGSAGSRTACARTSRVRSPPASTVSGGQSWSGSCSARTKGSPRSSATTSRPPGSITCSRSRVRTSPSWRSACWAWHGCSGSRGFPPRWPRWRRSPATCSRWGGSPRSSAPAWRERSPRSPGSSRDRGIAGTFSPSVRRSCSPGRLRACSSRASSSRSRPSARSSC